MKRNHTLPRNWRQFWVNCNRLVQFVCLLSFVRMFCFFSWMSKKMDRNLCKFLFEKSRNKSIILRQPCLSLPMCDLVEETSGQKKCYVKLHYNWNDTWQILLLIQMSLYKRCSYFRNFYLYWTENERKSTKTWEISKIFPILNM